MKRRVYLVLLTAAALMLISIYIACGGGGGSSTSKGASSPATINVSVSDPPTCSAPASGPYNSIIIAVTDVQINASATAGDNDSNWLDLTPALKNSGVPKQVDLLGIPNNQCFLAQLGSNNTIPPGTYQQIRIFLADNTAENANKVVGNKCASNAVNCVILAANPASPQTLKLSSESNTGIKIPSGQIAGGQFTVGSGDIKDLDINIDSCASIVVDQGNGTFRLKPVLHAGEVSAGSVINGTLVDNSTTSKQPIAGGKSIVALEQKDAAGIDRVIMETTADPTTGLFSFCPVPAGTYDVVAVAVNGAGVAYQATITTGVPAGTALGNIPMNPVTGTTTTAASIAGKITAVNANSNGTAVDVLLSAIEQVTVGTTNLQFTIPVATPSATLLVSVPSDCANNLCYTLTPVPPVNPTTGTFTTAPGGTPYNAGTGNASYVVEGQSFLPSSGGQTDCTPAKVTVGPVGVTAGNTATAPDMGFIGCQ